MPALNFKRRFKYKVESGEKRQTIRLLRKDGRNPRPGQTLYLYTGMRTKGCIKLKEVKCKSVDQLTIEENKDIIVGAKHLTGIEIYWFAVSDGFAGPHEFYKFFHDTHRLPFYGLLIKW